MWQFLQRLIGGGTSTTGATPGAAPPPAPAAGASPVPAPAPAAARPGAGGTTGGVSSGSGLSPEEMDRIHGAYTSGHSGDRTAVDPVALARMQDRQRAQTELAGRFQIVPTDFVGPRLPNQMTQAEYERMCNTYSDIRRGEANLRLDTAGMTAQQATAFQSSTMNDIASMLQTGSGRDLVEALAHEAGPNGAAHTTTIRGIADPGGAGVRAANPARNADRGNGVGTSNILSYAPGQSLPVPGATDPWWPVRSDAVLYHEMTHALYNLRGTRADGQVDPAGVPAVDRGVNRAEYQAMGLGDWANAPISENRYRAERRGLAGHAGVLPGDDGAAMAHATNYNPTMPPPPPRRTP